MKKIMILGGDNKSIPVIEAAKNRGYYTVLCDYNDKLDSINLVDKFYCVSVFDEDQIKEIATLEEVDGIVSYSSDKIAYIANKISYELNLSKNPVESFEILIKKDKFRRFLEQYGYNVPKSVSCSNLNENIVEQVSSFSFPVMVKPTDSAGSTGVRKISSIAELNEAFMYAKDNSKTQTVIIEEYIHMAHECMIAGDAFVYNGNVEFFGFLNSHRGLAEHPFIPTGTSFPFYLEKNIDEIKNTIQTVITDLKISNCPLNLELMYNDKGKLFIIEIAPRNGGNLIPSIILDTYGVDLFDALVSSSVGDIPNLELNLNYKYATTYVIRATNDGIFNNVEYDDILKRKIYREIYYKKTGDQVYAFDRANKAIGIIFLKFDSLDDEINIIHSIEEHIKVNLE